jgi:hypothetical protein
MLHCSSKNGYEEPYTLEYCDEETGWQVACYLSYFALPMTIFGLSAKKKQDEIKNWAIANETNFRDVCDAFSSKLEDTHGYFIEYRDLTINLRSVVSDGSGMVGHMA